MQCLARFVNARRNIDPLAKNRHRHPIRGRRLAAVDCQQGWDRRASLVSEQDSSENTLKQKKPGASAPGLFVFWSDVILLAYTTGDRRHRHRRHPLLHHRLPRLVSSAARLRPGAFAFPA